MAADEHQAKTMARMPWLIVNKKNQIIATPGINNDLTCSGFLGYEWAKEQAAEFAECANDLIINERRERAEWEARDVATV